MSEKTLTAKPRMRRGTIERTYNAPIEDVWNRWTTKEGIESWWGPEGFSLTVSKLDLHPGGQLHYNLTATTPEQIEFMQKAGMSLTVEGQKTYTEIAAPRRFGYTHWVDFVPDVEPYQVETVIELFPGAQGTRMLLTFDVLYDKNEAQKAAAGWDSELGTLALDKLAKVLAAARSAKGG